MTLTKERRQASEQKGRKHVGHVLAPNDDIFDVSWSSSGVRWHLEIVVGMGFSMGKDSRVTTADDHRLKELLIN